MEVDSFCETAKVWLTFLACCSMSHSLISNFCQESLTLTYECIEFITVAVVLHVRRKSPGLVSFSSDWQRCLLVWNILTLSLVLVFRKTGTVRVHSELQYECVLLGQRFWLKIMTCFIWRESKIDFYESSQLMTTLPKKMKQLLAYFPLFHFLWSSTFWWLQCFLN